MTTSGGGPSVSERSGERFADTGSPFADRRGDVLGGHGATPSPRLRWRGPIVGGNRLLIGRPPSVAERSRTVDRHLPLILRYQV
jgi:hypothetical protein